jgi:predicted carbohydrate-binding protein with CBM5 and CBM33 domain
MLRTLLALLVLLVLLLIAAVALGWIGVSRDENGRVGVEAREVSIGTETRNMQLPVVRLEERQVEVPAVGVRDADANQAR